MKLPLFLERRRQTIRFLAAGGVNTAFGMALYPGMLWTVPWLRSHYLLALGIAQAISVCFAFVIYKTAVFKTRANIAREFVRFISFYSLTYTVNWITLPFLVEVAQIRPVPAQVGFTLLMTVASYFWHSRLTFRREPHSPY